MQLLGLAGLMASSILMGQAQAQTPGPVVIPRDESPHPQDETEWWYFTGHLLGIDPSGHTHKYGFDLTFISANVLKQAPTAVLYFGQFAIADLTRGTFTADPNVTSIQADVIPPVGGYDNTVGTWHMAGFESVNNLHASFSDNSYGITLALTQWTPPALHGNKGIIPYGVFGTSAYYSYTNLQVSGVVMDHGVPVVVTGIAWHDHQYGNFGTQAGSWNWFSIQLNNDTQYMLYFLLDASRQIVQTVGTQVNPDGSTVNLDPKSFSATPLSFWTSPVTGAKFPVSWQVTVPGGTLTETALLPNQELVPASFTPGTSYWEGASAVSGTINGKAVTGQSYIELTPTAVLP